MKTLRITDKPFNYVFMILCLFLTNLLLMFFELDSLSIIFKKHGIYYFYWCVYIISLTSFFVLLDFKKCTNISLKKNLLLGSASGLASSIIAYSIAGIWKYENGLERWINTFLFDELWALPVIIFWCLGWFYGAIAGGVLLLINNKTN